MRSAANSQSRRRVIEKKRNAGRRLGARNPATPRRGVHLASTKSAEKTGGKMSGDSIVGIGAVLEPSPSGNLQVSTDPDGIPVSERAANRGS